MDGDDVTIRSRSDDDQIIRLFEIRTLNSCVRAIKEQNPHTTPALRHSIIKDRAGFAAWGGRMSNVKMQLPS